MYLFPERRFQAAEFGKPRVAWEAPRPRRSKVPLLLGLLGLIDVAAALLSLAGS